MADIVTFIYLESRCDYHMLHSPLTQLCNHWNVGSKDGLPTQVALGVYLSGGAYWRKSRRHETCTNKQRFAATLYSLATLEIATEELKLSFLIY